MSAPPTLLVTGGAGFIGSCFVALAVSKGAKVVVLDALTYAGGRDNLEGIAPKDSWELVEGSVCDGALVSDLLKRHGVSHVVNFAAESHVDNSILGPGAFIDTNIVGTFQLLEACRAYASGGDFRFLQVSTDEVYGSLGMTGRFCLESPFRPNSPYSASKAAADHLVRAWGITYGLPVITTHCSNNYGPRQHPEKLIPTMILTALAGKGLPVYGDGKNVRDWLHVQDHCEGLWLALMKGEPGSVHHFGSGDEVENLALVRMLCAILDRLRPKASGRYEEQICFVTDRPGHDRRYAIDDYATRAALGFMPKHALAEGLESTVAWYLANGAWCSKRQKRSEA